MDGLQEFSIIEYLNKHSILWQPIKLKIGAVKYDKDGNPNGREKFLCYFKDKNGNNTYIPNCNDFKDLTNEQIKERQDTIKDFKHIAIDTRHYMHIDIDKPNYPECFDEMMKEAPFIKSITKDWGRHILITSDFNPILQRSQFKVNGEDIGVELLSNGWTYASLTMFNGDKPPLFIDGDELKQQIEYKEPNKETNKETNKEQSDDDKNKYIELLFDVIGNGNYINYDIWFNIMACLKANEYSFDIFKKYTDLYQDSRNCAKYWDNLKNPYGTIHYLQKLAKEFNPEKYKVWLSKYNVFISLNTFRKSVNDVAKWMAPYVKDTLVYCDGWYICENGLWRLINKPKSFLVNFLQRKIDEALDNKNIKLSKETDEEEIKVLNAIKKEYFCFYSKCSTSGYYGTLIDLIASPLEDIEFINKLDTYTYKIFYKNGMLDLKTMEFRKTIYAKDYITKTINFDYEEPTEQDMNEVHKILKKICNWNDEHLNYYLSTMGYAMTGDSKKEQDFYYLRGETAGNGKSTIFESLNTIIPNYVHKANQDTFDKGADLRKEINGWRGLRILFNDELTEDKKNSELLKAIANGTTYKYNKLWSVDAIDMPINFKLFLTSNQTIDINMDEGIKRRLKMMQFNSLFRKEILVDDYDKLEFTIDKSMQSKLEGQYKHALLRMIFQKSKDYYINSGLDSYPKEWVKVNNEVIDDNDTFKPWFFDTFTIDEESMIHKDEFNDTMKEFYKNKPFDLKKLKDNIARLRVKVSYNANQQKKINNKKMKGYWVGLKYADE